MSARPYEEEASHCPAASEGGDSNTDMAMEEAQETLATPIKKAAAVAAATGRAARATKRDEDGSAAMKPGKKSTAAATGAGAGAKLGVRGGMINKVGCHNWTGAPRHPPHPPHRD
jgi:hypothetical protein